MLNKKNQNITRTKIVNWKYYLLPVIIAASLYSVVITDNLFGDEYDEYAFSVLGKSRFGMSTTLDIHTQLAGLGYLLIGQPWSIRLYSMFCGIGAIIFVGKLAQKYLSCRGTMIAIWLAVFSPFLIEFGAEARPNAIFIFAGVMFLYAFVLFMEEESLVNTLFVIFAGCFGILAREMFVSILIFCFGYYIIKRRKVTFKLIIAGLAMLPFLIRLYLRMNHYSNFAPKESTEAPVSLMNFLFRLPVALTFGYNTLRYPDRGVNFAVSVTDTIAANIITFICMSVVFVGFLIGFIILVKKDKRIIFLAAGVLVPVILLLVAQEAGFSILNVRHCAGILGVYLVLLAAIINQLYKYKLGKIVVILYIYLIAISLFHFYFQPEIYSRRSNYTALNTELENNLKNEDYIIVYYKGTNTSPDYLTAMQNTDNIIDIDHDLPSGMQIEEYINGINSICRGRIFFIVNIAMKNWVDPNNSAMSVLQKDRQYTVRKYGRNLSLFIFNELNQID